MKTNRKGEGVEGGVLKNRRLAAGFVGTNRSHRRDTCSWDVDPKPEHSIREIPMFPKYGLCPYVSYVPSSEGASLQNLVLSCALMPVF